MDAPARLCALAAEGPGTHPLRPPARAVAVVKAAAALDAEPPPLPLGTERRAPARVEVAAALAAALLTAFVPARVVWAAPCVVVRLVLARVRALFAVVSDLLVADDQRLLEAAG